MRFFVDFCGKDATILLCIFEAIAAAPRRGRDMENSGEELLC